MTLQQQLQEYYHYENGELFYRKATGPRKAGASAGSVQYYEHNGHNRVRVRFKGKLYYRYQLVFCYVHGYIPEMIDHINRNPMDDRVDNLRACTASEDQMNREDR